MSKKKILLMLLGMVTFLFTYAQTEFITVWKTDNNGVTANNQIRIPGTGTYSIQWESVSNPAVQGTAVGNGATVVTFPAAGTYRVKMLPTAPNTQMHFNMGPIINPGGPLTNDCRKLLRVEQWGSSPWGEMTNAFNDCQNMNVTATDLPDFSQVTSMEGMFANCLPLTGNATFNNWDVSNVTNMRGMFNFTYVFNQPLGNWDVGSVTNMSTMFFGAEIFNQPLGNWDVSSVTNMSDMFFGASAFNQPIGDWDVSSVTNMEAMFFDALAFNQPIGNWDVSGVTNMSDMFSGASAFNQPLGNWDVSSVTNMESMFSDAAAFNQPLSNWNVANVTNMEYMFLGAGSFNQSLGSWNLSSVGDVTDMLSSSGMDCLRYDSTLIGWANAATTPNGLSLGAAGLIYSSANGVTARSGLVSKGWTITGDSFDASCQATLPVVFGPVSAFIDGNTLTAYWSSLKETNNHHFEVLASTDGRNFVKLGETGSLARDGNSDEKIDYSFSLDIGSKLALGVSLISMLAAGVSYRRRRRWQSLVFAGVFIAGLLVACSRQDEVVTDKGRQVFVRIVQVDIDGKSDTSKVVQAVRK